MASAIWCDEQDVAVVGAQVGFLVEVVRHNQRTRKYVLQPRPCHTNRSHEPRLTGWCGETDNVSRYASGLARISRVAANGRIQLVRVKATPEILESLGYPELVS